MNLSAGILVLALAAALPSPAAAAGSGTPPETSVFQPAATETILAEHLVVLHRAEPRPGIQVQTNRFFRLPRGTKAPNAQPLRPPANSELRPGVYETWPYTCIVVVPGPHPDEQRMPGATPAPPGDPGQMRMPTRKPDLQFIPRQRKP